jgi:hypothetical protein
MTKDETIDRLWESSNHGTRREDIVAAYEAGERAARSADQPAAAPCWACEGRGRVDMMSGSHGQSSWTETCPYCTTADKPGAVQS